MNCRRDVRRQRLAYTAILPVVGLIAAGCGGGAEDDTQAAQEGTEAESCYEGERLTFGVAYGPGGLYDLFARTLAPYLEEELGATVVVENMPGAGGLTAANQVYTAEPDGLTIGFFSGQGLAGAVLGGSEGVQFDLQEFTHVARLSAADRLLVGSPQGETSIDALQAAEGLKYASAGPGGADHIDATVLIPTLGLDADIVTGYKGSAETATAVTSGDADLTSGTVPSRMDGVVNGDLVPVLVIGEETNERLPDVPVLGELDLDEQQEELADAHMDLKSVGSIVLAPPGVPEDCAAELESAFETAASDPELVAAMEKFHETVEFTSGAELREVIQSVLDAPEPYVELLEGAYATQ